MKKVLLVFGSLERAGAQLRMLEVCRSLQQSAPIHFDFCVLGQGPIQLASEATALGGAIYELSLRSPRFMSHFSTLLQRGHYEIVSSFPKLLSGIIVWAAARQEVPIRIVNFRNTLGEEATTQPRLTRRWSMRRAFAWLMRLLIQKNATQVAAVSHAALDSMYPPAWQRTSACQVIYSGIELGAYQGPRAHAEVCKEFGWPTDSRLIINVARFSPQKNHKTLVAAMRLAYEQAPTLRLLLVGEGKLQPEIAALIQQYDLQEICAFTGLRRDVPRLLLASDLFFFPSLWEGLPGAPLEALAAGLPVVASDIAPIQEIARHFPASFLLAAPNDVRQHAAHLRQGLATTMDRSAAQAHFATTPFAIANAMKAYRTLYGVT